ncbi:MAG: hypothetical protein HY791_03220 [Deltaproteobacteria bacterium]|nr:hypothetical protein [Deltaproteobacteria bacterium]
MRTSLLFGLSFVLFVLLTAPSAEAVPVFSRTYSVPCQTCHIAITRRNEFGDVFRKHGYHWPGGMERRATGKAQPVDLLGVSLLEGGVPGQIPLAISASFSGSYSNDPELTDAIGFGTPSLTLLFAGSLHDHVGFFGTWSGRGAPNELHMDLVRLFDRPELNLRLGRFEPTTTLFKSNDTLLSRLILGSGALDGFSLSAGRIGVELGGIVFGRAYYSVGLVQESELGGSPSGYYHASVKLGGMDFLGAEPEIDLEDPSFFDDFVVKLGHWGYRGAVRDPDGTDAALIRRFGFDATLSYLDFGLIGGLMLGADGDLALRRNNHSLTWFAEASYSPLSWMILAYLFQYQDAESLTRETIAHDLGAMFLIFENFRLRLKGSVTQDEKSNESAELQAFFAF